MALYRRGRGDGVFLPCLGAQNFVDLFQGKVAFLFAIVEVRRDADAGVRAIIHEDLARQELPAHFVGVGTIDGDGAAAFRGVIRGIDAPTARLRAFKQSRGHGDGFGADGRDAGLVDDVQARLARVQSGNVRGAVEITERIFARVDGAGLECERTAVGDPAG